MAKIEQLNAKTGNKEKIFFDYLFPESLAEAVEMYPGPEDNREQVVFDMFTKSLTIAVQAPVRRMMDDDATLEQIQEYVNTWKPGTKATRSKTMRVANPMKQILEGWDDLPKEVQDNFMAQIEARWKARNAGENGVESSTIEDSSPDESPTESEEISGRRRR